MHMTEATTRDELEAAVKEALSPADVAMVDQMVAAVEEGMRMRARNRALTAFDPVISALMADLLRGQALPASEYVSPYRADVSRTLRLRVSGGWPTIAEVEPFTPSRQGEAVCLRCARVTDQMSYLDVPGGRVVVEMCFCPNCADHLERAFGPLDWNLRDAAV